MILRFPAVSPNSFTLNEQSDRHRLSPKQASLVFETSDIVHLGVKHAPKFAGKRSRESSQVPMSPVEVKNENSGSEAPEANSSRKRRKLSPSRLKLISGRNLSPFKKSSTASRSNNPSSPKLTASPVKLTTRRGVKRPPGEKKQARLKSSPLSRFRRLVLTTDKSKESVALASDWNTKGKAGDENYNFGRDISHIDIQNARQYNAEKTNLPAKLAGYLSDKPKPSDDTAWQTLAEQCKKDLKLKHRVLSAELQGVYASLQHQSSIPSAFNSTVSNPTLGHFSFHTHQAPRMGYTESYTQFSGPAFSTQDGLSPFMAQQPMIKGEAGLYPARMMPPHVSYQTQALMQNNQSGMYGGASPYSSQHALAMGMQPQGDNRYGSVIKGPMDLMDSERSRTSGKPFEFDITGINFDFRPASSEAKSPAVKSEKSTASGCRLAKESKPFINTQQGSREGSTDVKPKKKRVRRLEKDERPRVEQFLRNYTGELEGSKLARQVKQALSLRKTPKPYDLNNIRAKIKKEPQMGLGTEPQTSNQSHINAPGSPLEDWGSFYDKPQTSSLESKAALGQPYSGFNFTDDAKNAFEFDPNFFSMSQPNGFELMPQQHPQFYNDPLPAPKAIHPPASLLIPGRLFGNNSPNQSQRMPAVNPGNIGFPILNDLSEFPIPYSDNDVTSQQRMQGVGQYPQDNTFSPFHGLPQDPSNANFAFSKLGGDAHMNTGIFGNGGHQDIEAFIKSLERHSPRL